MCSMMSRVWKSTFSSNLSKSRLTWSVSFLASFEYSRNVLLVVSFGDPKEMAYVCSAEIFFSSLLMSNMRVDNSNWRILGVTWEMSGCCWCWVRDGAVIPLAWVWSGAVMLLAWWVCSSGIREGTGWGVLRMGWTPDCKVRGAGGKNAFLSGTEMTFVWIPAPKVWNI